MLNHYNRFIVSHGKTFTDINEMTRDIYGYNNHFFKCPSNIQIVMFEHFGKYFNQNDSGFIYNYIVNNLENKNSNIDKQSATKKFLDKINNRKIEIPILGTKEYFCQVYNSDNNVPNIAFDFADNEVQTGIYLFSNESGDLSKSYTEFCKTEDGIFRVKYKSEFFDRWSVDHLLGGVKSVSDQNACKIPIYSFNKTTNSLENIVKLLNEVLTLEGNTCTLFVISCRNFESPLLMEQYNLIVQNN